MAIPAGKPKLWQEPQSTGLLFPHLPMSRPIEQLTELVAVPAPSLRRCTHFVGFRDDRYWAAVRAFGKPDFVHRGWDLRARREIADGDLIVFADGGPDQVPRVKSFDDIREPKE
jgi:hypothetical protein